MATSKIVILGAGFAGVSAARELTALLPESEGRDIVVVDQNNFSLFTPMLTEVAGGQVDPDDIAASIRALAPRITFEQGRVEHIDAASKAVTIAIGDGVPGISPVQRTLHADHLVIALGSITNFHHISGLQDHSLTIKTVEEAVSIRNRALALLERADEEPDSTIRQALLTFVVGGGGFSGVETMGALNALVRGLVGARVSAQSGRRYQHVEPDNVRMLLVHPGPRLLPEISERLAADAQMELEQRGVEVMLNTLVTGAGDDYVEVKSHQVSPGSSAQDQAAQRIQARTLVWAGGVKPSPVVDGADLTLGHHGGIVVDGCCAVSGHSGIWALGDCAEIPRPGGNETYAPTAQNATREGSQVARNIVSTMRGEAPQPFVYHAIGELAIVGKRSGVASVYGMRFSGILAWAMWRAIYLAKLPGLAKKARVGLDWLFDAVSNPEIAALPGAANQSGKGDTPPG